jgi:hypothetical protein
VTTDKKPSRPSRSRSRTSRSRGRRAPAASAPPEAALEPEAPPEVASGAPFPEPTIGLDVIEPPPQELPPTSVPEPAFARRVVPPLPRRLPDSRRAIFFDVENTSRPEHIARVLAYLAIDRIECGTELVAVGNWRVASHESARLLARHGAHLVHSAPSVGVRDWSDLRIAVGAGVWLAGARAGDTIDVITDDQAFDAVGDVAASLGVAFRRLSFRSLAGVVGELPVEEPAREAQPSGGRRRRRGSRRGGGHREAPPARSAPSTPRREVAPVNRAEAGDDEGHTAPNEEIIEVIRQLLGSSPERGASIDAVSNALKGRGFRRPAGSLRLITRLRRIKELDVSRNGTIRLAGVGSGAADEVAETPGEGAYASGGGGEAEGDEGAGEDADAPEPSSGEAAAPAGTRRRRRRGGRRRRGRGGGQTVVAAP